MNCLIQADTKLFLLINHLQNRFLDYLTLWMNSITEFALLWFFIVFLILFFDKVEKKRKIFLILLALLINSWIVNVLFKIVIFCRVRPFGAIEGVKIIGRVWENCSFPSGHVAASTTALIVLFYLFKKFRKKWLILSAVLFVLFLAFARIYAGMHYPSDVLGGTIVGLISALLAIWLDKQIKFSNL